MAPGIRCDIDIVREALVPSVPVCLQAGSGAGLWGDCDGEPQVIAKNGSGFLDCWPGCMFLV